MRITRVAPFDPQGVRKADGGNRRYRQRLRGVRHRSFIAVLLILFFFVVVKYCHLAGVHSKYDIGGSIGHR